MKTIKLLITPYLLLLFLTGMNAQETSDSKMIYDDPKISREIMDLMNWQDIGYQPVTFGGPAIKGKDYYVVSKEIWYGIVKRTDTLINTATSNFFEPVKDTLKFTVMSGKSSEKTLRTLFKFERFSLDMEYISTVSNDYSMRVYGTQSAIELNKPFYAFAFILPYEKDNGKYYCAVESSGKDIEKWGKEFGIDHYVLFEMCFYERKAFPKK